ncbi:hypothetical protein ACXYRQ_02840 [Mycoplasma sp. 394]
MKKFTGWSQGTRAVEGKKEGENFLKNILNILNIQTLQLTPGNKFHSVKSELEPNNYMSPDFVINCPNTFKIKFKNRPQYLFLESKFKQINGSDWEKLESNFGYHHHFYNKLSELFDQDIRIQTIVILVGFWKILQKNYWNFIDYYKSTYGEFVIFDFGFKEDIYTFARLMDIKLNKEQEQKIEEAWIKVHKID